MFTEDVRGHLQVDLGGPEMALSDQEASGPTPFRSNLNRWRDTYPWEYGLVALGNKLVHNKKISQPIALGIGAALHLS